MDIFQLSTTHQETPAKPKQLTKKTQEIKEKHPFLPPVNPNNAWDVKTRIFLENPAGLCTYLGTKRSTPLTAGNFDQVRIITGGCLFSYSTLIGTDNTGKQIQLTNPSSVQELLISNQELRTIETTLGPNQLSVNNLESVSRIQRHANGLIQHLLDQDIETELVIDIPLAEYIIYYLELYNENQLSSELFLKLIHMLKTYRNTLKQNYGISCNAYIQPQFTNTLDFLTEWLTEKITQGEKIHTTDAAKIIKQESDNRALHQAFEYAQENITGKYSYWTPFLNQSPETLCIQLDNLEEFQIQRTISKIPSQTTHLNPIGIYPLPDYEFVDQNGTHITRTFYTLNSAQEKAGQQCLGIQHQTKT